MGKKRGKNDASFVQSTQTNDKEGKKKNSPVPSKPGTQHRQVQGSINMVVGVGLGPSNQNQLAR